MKTLAEIFTTDDGPAMDIQQLLKEPTMQPAPTKKQKPGPKPGSGRGLTERVQFHGLPGIRARIKAKADYAGVRASEFMRILLGEE